jgi:hypothetical protein
MGPTGKRICAAMAIAMGTFIALTGPAYAYIDPGSGGYILQLLIGAFLGASAAIAIFWRRIVGFFRRGPKSTETGSSEEG